MKQSNNVIAMQHRQFGVCRRLKPLAIWGIFLVAFTLRLNGNTFGLPYFFHPDETKLTAPAWRIIEQGKWNPGNFFYPTGLIYFLCFGFKFLSIFSLNFHNYQADIVMLHWIGRFYSALLGAGTVVLAYNLVRKAYGFSQGIVVSIFLCLNFIHIKYSHYATTDIASIFFILLSLYFIISSFQAPAEQSRSRTTQQSAEPVAYRAIFLAALFGGIATGIKYSAWLIIFPLILAMLEITRQRVLYPKGPVQIGRQTPFLQAVTERGRAPYLAGGLLGFFYLLGFFLTTPFAFIDLRHFLSSLVEIVVIPHSRWLGLTHPGPFYYFYDFRPIAGVGGIFILSILGLISRLKNWSWPDTILISFFLPYIALASLSIEKIDRFFLPAIIIFVIWAGAGLNSAALILGRLRGRPCLILSVFVILLSVYPLFKAIRYIQTLEGKDTRIIASQWISKNIPPHTNLALFNHSWANPPLEDKNYRISSIPLIYKDKDIDREKFKLRLSKNRIIVAVAGELFGEKMSPDLFQKRIDRLTLIEEFTLFPLSYFQENGVDYIIISGFFKEDLLDKDTERYFPRLNSSSRSFFNELSKEAKLVYFLPAAHGFGKDFALSPSIEIYETKKLK